MKVKKKKKKISVSVLIMLCSVCSEILRTEHHEEEINQGGNIVRSNKN